MTVEEFSSHVADLVPDARETIMELLDDLRRYGVSVVVYTAAGQLAERALQLYSDGGDQSSQQLREIMALVERAIVEGESQVDDAIDLDFFPAMGKIPFGLVDFMDVRTRQRLAAGGYRISSA